jgi:hypothetical protein
MAMQFGNHTPARVPAWYLPVGKRMPHHDPSPLKWRWNQAISRSALKSEDASLPSGRIGRCRQDGYPISPLS